MAQIYHYDNNGYYIDADEADLDPLGNQPIVPAYATLTAPPAPADNKKAKWNEAKEQWSQVPDYRGRRYWTKRDGLIEIAEVGVSPPAGATELTAGQTLMQDGESWRLRTDADDLADAKKAKIAELKAAVERAIKSGFNSSALGQAHTYDSEQHNIDWIQAAVLSADKTQITCDDGTGGATSKTPREHTVAECNQVLIDGMAKLLTHKTRVRTLRDQVNAAADVQAVEAVKW